MTSSETLKSLYFFRKELEKLVYTYHDCEGIACTSCPLHMPYDVLMQNHMRTDCAWDVLRNLNKDLPIVCTECGHVVTTRLR